MFHDTIFDTIIDFKFPVEKDDISRFNSVMETKGLPDEFIFETLEGMFKVNKLKKEFRILERHYYIDGIPYEKVDYTIMAMYKIALWSGYSVFLEPKYSN